MHSERHQRGAFLGIAGIRPLVEGERGGWGFHRCGHIEDLLRARTTLVKREVTLRHDLLLGLVGEL